MRNLIACFLLSLGLLCLAGCSADGVLGLRELETLSEEDVLEALDGRPRDDIVEAWGEPDGMLSGFWGDTWHFGEGDGRIVVVYYDRDGLVENVKIGERSK